MRQHMFGAMVGSPGDDDCFQCLTRNYIFWDLVIVCGMEVIPNWVPGRNRKGIQDPS